MSKPKPKHYWATTFKADEPYSKWLHGLARHEGAPMAAVIATALAALAQRSGYRQPPARLRSPTTPATHESSPGT